jgi:hypothetical protein
MTQTPRVVYRARDDATPEAETSALAAIYSFVIRSSQAKKKADGMTSANGSMLRDTKEVSDVERQPD